jgi:hypothetical protein
MQEFMEIKREGLSTQAISKLTGYDCKTVRNYLRTPETAPGYGPRSPVPSKLDAHKPYLQDRLKAGVWNAQVLVTKAAVRFYALKRQASPGVDGVTWQEYETGLEDRLHPATVSSVSR